MKNAALQKKKKKDFFYGCRNEFLAHFRSITSFVHSFCQSSKSIKKICKLSPHRLIIILKASRTIKDTKRFSLFMCGKKIFLNLFHPFKKIIYLEITQKHLYLSLFWWLERCLIINIQHKIDIFLLAFKCNSVNLSLDWTEKNIVNLILLFITF